MTKSTDQAGTRIAAVSTESILPRWERWIAIGIIAAFGLLALAYSLGPLFEGQDEVSHYRVIRYLLKTKALPGKDWDPESSDESQQAPLYYVIGAILRAPLDDSDFEASYFQRDLKNKSAHYEVREPNNDNKNVRFHPPYEDFPYNQSGTALVAHVLRLYSAILGIGTVFFSWKIFQILWPDRPDRRLLALGIIVFWPHFIYVAATITNDVLVYFTGTLSLFLLLRLLKHGPTWRGAIILGVALGLAMISKANATFLVLPVGIAVVADRRMWKYAPVVLALTLLISGWWYVRNQILYGGFGGFEGFWQHKPASAVEPGNLTFGEWAERMLITYDFVWARFGLAFIPVSDAIYRFFDVLTGLSLVGFVVWLVKRIPQAIRGEIARHDVLNAIIVAAFIVCWVAALGYVATVEKFGVHARHLYPAMAGWGVLFATGLDSWTPRALRLRACFSQIALHAVIPVVCLFGYILPAYQLSPVPATIQHPLSYQYEDVARLIGIDQPDIHVYPGQRLYITIYWQALKPVDEDLLAFLHTVGSDVVKRDSTPGTGNLPSAFWQPGQMWGERYFIVIPADAEIQRTYPLIAGLHHPSKNNKKSDVLEVTGPQGLVNLPVVGRVTINSQPKPFDPDYRFGSIIGMAQPKFARDGSNLNVCFDWVSLATTQTAYHVFIHVATPDNPVAAQADMQPQNGNFPTSAWLPGESIHDCVDVDVSAISSPGWKVLIGLYDLATGARLPVADRRQQALPDNAVSISP